MKVAAVDIGTNTVRLLIADVVQDGPRFRVQEPERHEVITRLGEGLDETGHLGEEPIGRALAGLGHFAGLIEKAGVARTAGVATSATRSSANGTEFISRATDVLGFRPRVIDGAQEARLTFAGATNGMSSTMWSFCVIDVGGGSTEFVVGHAFPEYVISVDIGSVRLTERVRSGGLSDSSVIREYVDSLFEGVSPPYPPSVVLGSGGTFVTLGAVYAGLTKDEMESEPGLILGFEELCATVERLQHMSVAEIAQLPGVAPARAGVLRAGALCAERAVARIGSSQVRISVADILDGIALELAEL